MYILSHFSKLKKGTQIETKMKLIKCKTREREKKKSLANSNRLYCHFYSKLMYRVRYVLRIIAIRDQMQWQIKFRKHHRFDRFFNYKAYTPTRRLALNNKYLKIWWSKYLAIKSGINREKSRVLFLRTTLNLCAEMFRCFRLSSLTNNGIY